jgi:hypothetical protein
MLTTTPQRKSRKMKIDVERALAAPTPRGGLLFAADFDKSEWEIMYPFFLRRASLTLPNV